MKIIQINAVNKIASTGRTTWEMTAFLTENGHDAVSAYSKGISTDSKKEYVFGSIVDAKLHALFSRINGKQASFSVFSTKKFLRFLSNFSPDVVVIRNLHANYINLPMLLKYLAKKDIPTVAVLHDCWFYTGGCFHYTKIGCGKWQASCGNCPIVNSARNSWFFDRTKNILNERKKLFGAIPRLAVVGVSDWLKAEAEKSPVFKNAKIITRIYNWIDIDKFRFKDTENLRKEMGVKDKKIMLCVASGWSKAKGFDTVLEISKKLNENEKILLVGDIKEDVLLSDNIIHIPTTHSVDQLVSFYSAADVFLQPSLEETFGKVTAEALSCGTPVVCFNSTANPELIGDGCGAVAADFSADSMLNEARKILAAGKEKYSEHCRNFVLENFEKGKNLTKYLELFNNLICKG